LKTTNILLLVVISQALCGCELASAPVLDPGGPVAMAQRELMFETLAIMMIVVIPVWVLAGWFIPRFRAGGNRERYAPGWHSARVETVIWLVPAAIIVTVGTYVWTYTHRLDPYRTVASASATEPLQVLVIAQDWKWLFLYPAQGIASVNELVFPSGVPLELTITSDTVMNSLYIPGLGSQIYAMAGMETELNLLAWEPGRFTGRNTQYSGRGFSWQYFDVVATSGDDFDSWVDGARQSRLQLDEAAYRQLAAPSIAHPVTHYRSYKAGLFQEVVARYLHAPDHGSGMPDTGGK